MPNPEKESLSILRVLRSSSILEKLSAQEHARWAHWQRYLHSRCSRLPDGSLLIPASLVERWERQIDTSYENLSDSEKNSDRSQAQHTLDLLEQVFVSS